MYIYAIGIFVPVTVISLYLFNRYRRIIRDKCTDVALSLLVDVGTRVFNNKRPVQVEKRYVCVPYQYHGIDYQVYIPFSRSLRRKMINNKTTLIKSNGEEVELSQQPGCCYLVTASMLGGQAIKTVNLDTGEENLFEGDDIPVFK